MVGAIQALGTTSPLAHPLAARWLPAVAARVRASRELVRFVAVGLAASVSYALVFLVVGRVPRLGDHVSNLVATIASTVLANELHRRFTFRGAAGASVARSQGTGAVTAAVGLAASTMALAGWHRIAPDAGSLSSIVVVYLVTGIVGLANFVALRTALGGRRPAKQPTSADPAPAAEQVAAASLVPVAGGQGPTTAAGVDTVRFPGGQPALVTASTSALAPTRVLTPRDGHCGAGRSRSGCSRPDQRMPSRSGRRTRCTVRTVHGRPSTPRAPGHPPSAPVPVPRPSTGGSVSGYRGVATASPVLARAA